MANASKGGKSSGKQPVTGKRAGRHRPPPVTPNPPKHVWTDNLTWKLVVGPTGRRTMKRK